MTDQDVVDIASLIHGKWSDAYLSLKAVKEEVDDGSPDWELFHADRLKFAIAEDEKWGAFNQRFIDEHREVIARAFGLDD